MTRAPAVRLSDTQKWDVAKYCIENRGVIQSKDTKKYDTFRVGATTLAREISASISLLNLEEGITLTAHHVNISVGFYNLVCELTNNLPEPPAEVSTVKEDMLTTELEKKNLEIKKLTEMLGEQSRMIMGYSNMVSEVRASINKVNGSSNNRIIRQHIGI